MDDDAWVVPTRTTAAVGAGMLTVWGTALGVLGGELPPPVGLSVLGIVSAASITWLAGSLIPAYVRETKPSREAAVLKEHAAGHHNEPPTREGGGWLRTRLARLHCRSGFGHCVHPRVGEQMSRLVFRDDGVEHVDPGGWCCECPATWTRVGVLPKRCQVCDAG